MMDSREMAWTTASEADDGCARVWVTAMGLAGDG